MSKRLDTPSAARCLGVPIDTIERWVRQGKVPAHRRGSEWTFDSAELREWARLNGMPFDTDPRPVEVGTDAEPVSVAQALARGGVHREVEAANVDQVLAALARHAPVADSGREALLERIKAREELSSTGIGHGVAVPHPREPMSELVREPSLTVCLLGTGVDFGAIDGRPVKAALLLLSPDVQTHLQLLSRVAFCLADDTVAALLGRSDTSHEELVRELSGVEARIGSRRG